MPTPSSTIWNSSMSASRRATIKALPCGTPRAATAWAPLATTLIITCVISVADIRTRGSSPSLLN